MKLSNKTPRFYVSIVACAFSLISAVLYGVLFSKIEYKEPVFDMKICVLLAVAGVIALILELIGERTRGYAPAVLCLASGVSLMMFIKMVIWPVADTIYGIEPFPQFVQLVICAVMILLTLIISEVVLYMKQNNTKVAE